MIDAKQIEAAQQVAACIVTYNPELARLTSNIEAVAPQVGHIYLVDNGSDHPDAIVRAVDALSVSTRCEITMLANAQNEGVATALNELCYVALQDGYAWALTLDQDSVCPDGMVATLFSMVSSLDIAIVCPILYSTKKESYITGRPDDPATTEVDECITSGSLLRLSAWAEVGGCDEAMFIDSVDYDLCHRLRGLGYRILRTSKVTLDHELGTIVYSNNLLGRRMTIAHSPARHYYISRNRLYLDRKENVGLAGDLLLNARCLVGALLLEPEGPRKALQIAKGTLDGMLMRVEPHTYRLDDLSDRSEEDTGDHHPTVSVVIPSYNRAHVLRKSIDSVLNQTYTDLELIVVDDCSSDATEELVCSLEDSRVRYHCLEKNSGACVARNTGVALARGTYIAFQDSDDAWRPTKIETQMRALVEAKADICFCRMERHGYDESFKTVFPTIEAGMVSYEELLRESLVSTQTILATRELCVAHSFDSNFRRLQDWDWIVGAADGKRVCLVDEVLVDVYLQDDSLSSAGDEKLVAAFQQLFDKYASVRKRYPSFEASLLVAMGMELARLGRSSEDYFRRAWSIDHKSKTFAKLLLAKVGLLGKVIG